MIMLQLNKPARTYANNGIYAQQCVEYTLLGTVSKHDNKPFWVGGDVGNIQVKSPKATISHELSIEEHLAKDGATSWGYVLKDFSIMYLMDKAEYIEFVKAFTYLDYDSRKNGSTPKLRLYDESERMRKWLVAHIWATSHELTRLKRMEIIKWLR